MCTHARVQQCVIFYNLMIMISFWSLKAHFLRKRPSSKQFQRMTQSILKMTIYDFERADNLWRMSLPHPECKIRLGFEDLEPYVNFLQKMKIKII